MPKNNGPKSLGPMGAFRARRMDRRAGAHYLADAAPLGRCGKRGAGPMFWKLLALLAVVALAWTLFSRRRQPAPPRRRLGRMGDQTLVKCRACGIYLPAGECCPCKDGTRST